MTKLPPSSLEQSRPIRAMRERSTILALCHLARGQAELAIAPLTASAHPSPIRPRSHLPIGRRPFRHETL
jgi:hypothetical protein